MRYVKYSFYVVVHLISLLHILFCIVFATFLAMVNTNERDMLVKSFMVYACILFVLVCFACIAS